MMSLWVYANVRRFSHVFMYKNTKWDLEGLCDTQFPYKPGRKGVVVAHLPNSNEPTGATNSLTDYVAKAIDFKCVFAIGDFALPSGQLRSCNVI